MYVSITNKKLRWLKIIDNQFTTITWVESFEISTKIVLFFLIMVSNFAIDKFLDLAAHQDYSFFSCDFSPHLSLRAHDVTFTHAPMCSDVLFSFRNFRFSSMLFTVCPLLNSRTKFRSFAYKLYLLVHACVC